MITGKCLCGEISYSLNSDLLYLYHCHCEQCRAFSGSSFATNASIIGKDLNLKDPNSNLKKFETKNGVRCFCQNCGSPIYSYARENKKLPALHCGTITGYPDKRLDANIHMAEKCYWTKVDHTVDNFQRTPD